jgi:hypothetical protein
MKTPVINHIAPPTTAAAYDLLLFRAWLLMDALPDTPEEYELVALVDVLMAYEEQFMPELGEEEVHVNK